jgi:uncharacterized protein (TIGR03067 family)
MTRFRICLAALFCAGGFAVFGGSSILADDKAAVEKETKKFQGTWTIESSVTGGQEIPRDQLKGFLVIYEGEKHTVKNGDKVIQVGTQKIDPSKSPKTIDVTMTEGPEKGKVMLGIYEFDGDTMKVCFDPQGKKRPTEFKSEPGSANFVNVHKRVKSTAQEPALDKPQPEHKLLERFAGEWHFEKLSAPEAGSKPENLGTGMISAELVGGFFVVSRWSGNVYGAEYKAFQSLGYNIKEKKYTGCWIDSTMSYRWPLSGAVDTQSQELTITASGPGPTGGTCTFRERYQFHSEDSITIIGEMQQREKWIPFLTTNLTRKR